MIIFQHLKLNLNEVKVFSSGGRPLATPLSITRTSSLTEEEIKAAEKMRGVMLAVRPLLIEGVVYQPFLCYSTLLLGIL